MPPSHVPWFPSLQAEASVYFNSSDTSALRIPGPGKMLFVSHCVGNYLYGPVQEKAMVLVVISLPNNERQSNKVLRLQPCQPLFWRLEHALAHHLQ